MEPLTITVITVLTFQVVTVAVLFATRRRARVNNAKMRHALKVWVRAHPAPVALQGYGR